MARRILYISGTRADFGLMRRTLSAIRADPDLSLSIIATGMHLSAAHGDTVREIDACGLPIIARVPITIEPATGATMARGIADMTRAFTDIMEVARPDIVLLLGDRGEMLAGAIAALHLNIAIAHIHGGERSGTVDEPVRHAVSKLSHIHLAATENARERLVRMGESALNVHVTGAPGIDGLSEADRASRSEVAGRHGLNAARPFALMVYHPVLQEASSAGANATMVLDAILSTGLQALVLMPNADAGSDAVRSALFEHRSHPDVTLLTHLEREEFLDAMATAEVMIGNSSAGIIEAATFGTPVINIGTRQNLRERNKNVIDVAADRTSIELAIEAALEAGRYAPGNIYGDGQASRRIVSILRDTPLDALLMMKTNEY